jgi:AraC-like DNA-binding protein
VLTNALSVITASGGSHPTSVNHRRMFDPVALIANRSRLWLRLRPTDCEGSMPSKSHPGIERVSPKHRVASRLPGPTSVTTKAAHQVSVERAIELMRERMHDPLDLKVLAHAALLSPYHFNRVFRIVTGVPPGRFLTALRMAEARRLLLTTDLRVTDACYAVGFESLGTFTSRFRELVGLAPRTLRALTETYGNRKLAELADFPGNPRQAAWALIHTAAGWPCVAIVGSFATAVPQGWPAACAVVEVPGRFALDPHPSPEHHVLALGFPEAHTVLDAMLLDPCDLLVGELHGLTASDRWESGGVHKVLLRDPRPVDPPIVLAAPVLSAAQKMLTCSRRG